MEILYIHLLLLLLLFHHNNKLCCFNKLVLGNLKRLYYNNKLCKNVKLFHIIKSLVNLFNYAIRYTRDVFNNKIIKNYLNSIR